MIVVNAVNSNLSSSTYLALCIAHYYMYKDMYLFIDAFTCIPVNKICAFICIYCKREK